MSDAQLEIYSQYTTSQSRYVYFLLAAAAAAMGIAINLTRDAALSYNQLALAAAVGCWALSFYAGSRNRSYVIGLLSANRDLLAQRKTQSEMRVLLSEPIDQSGKWGGRQFRYLILGAVFFIVWHVWGMLDRTAGPATPSPATKSSDFVSVVSRSATHAGVGPSFSRGRDQNE